MKKRIYIVIIILILIFIIFKFYKSNKNVFNDILIFGLWNNITENDEVINTDKNNNDKKYQYEYVINPQKQSNLQIDMLKTIKNEFGTNQKIAPGSVGKFIIKIDKENNIKSRIIIKDATKKPENLVFILNGEEFYSIKQLEEKINEIIKETNRIIINWEWKYETNKEQDMQDTKDGKNAQNYIFEVEAILE